MKNFLAFCCCFCFTLNISVYAQVAINTDAAQPDASAMLDVKSKTKGLLLPRMTTAQKAAITSPADGLLVYDTDTKSIWYYKKGTGWKELGSGLSAFSLPFSDTATSTSTLFSITNLGTGNAISGSSSGGTAMYGVSNALSGAGVLADNTAGGESVVGRTASVSGTPTGAVVGRNDGPGYGVYGFVATDVSGTGIGVLGNAGVNGGTGIAGHFENLNPSNPATALEAVTNGTGSAATIASTNGNDTSNALQVTSNGPGVTENHSQGNAGNFFNNNTNGVGAGVRGEVNSTFANNGTAGVYGTASGTGGYGGYFEHSSATGFGSALYVANAGLGQGAAFFNTNASNTQQTVDIETVGTGSAATINITNSSNTANALNVTTAGGGNMFDHTRGNAGNFVNSNSNGVGAGVRGEVNSMFANKGTAGVYGVASGTGGYGGYFEHSSTTGFGNALYVINAGLGQGAIFSNTNASNLEQTVSIVTSGLASAATIQNSNMYNQANTLNVTSNGPGVIADHSQGNAGNFFMDNTNGESAGVRGEVNSQFADTGTAGVYGVASGTGGFGGYFECSNANCTSNALYVTNAGLGRGAEFFTTNPSNIQQTVDIQTVGTGSGATIENSNNGNTSNTLNVFSNGQGLIHDHSQGNAGNFVLDYAYGVAAGVRGEVNSIYGNNGTAGVYGVASGTGGYGGYFEHTETTGFGVALQVVSNDQGYAMVVDHEGTGDLAVFQHTGTNVARIDNTGKGYFDGGTQNSGADLAEAFDVEGNYKDYEAGDVLEISATTDRTVVKSSTAYSTLVAGVYATKPGVLLTEASITDTATGRVPMGVVGVIPTKVCDENGPIARGDLLVTASKAGYAMKADLNKVKPGQVLGKALQEFKGQTGKIKVLVNVR